MKTWRKLALVGFVASVSAAGCVVGSGDDDGDTNTVGGAGGTTAGTGGKGGSGTGGTGTGGTTGGTGGTGTGGSAGTGGSGTGGTGGSGAIQCDPTGNLGGTPGTCTPDNANDACQVCIQQNCCTAWNNCTATTPDNPCYFGGPPGSQGGEVGCYQQCIIDAQLDGGVASQEQMGICAGICVTPTCTTIAATTNDMTECLNNVCFADCLEVQ